MKTFTKTITFLSLFLFLSAQAVSAQTNCTSCTDTSCSLVTLSFTYNGSTTTYQNVPWIMGTTVRTAMLSAQIQNGFTFTTTPYCLYGDFLMSFNGVYAGSSSYWALYINGSYANYGMDFQAVNPNDKISWVLTSTSQSQVTTASTDVKAYEAPAGGKTPKISHQDLLLRIHLEKGIGRVKN